MTCHDWLKSPIERIRLIVTIWAYLRLVVSIIWSVSAMYGFMYWVNWLTYHSANDPDFLKDPDNSMRVLQPPIFLIQQLIQSAMLVTLIVAGHKRMIKLYRIYFVYAFVDFVVYLLVMVPYFFVGFHTFLTLYLSFHTVEFAHIMTPTDRDGDFFIGISFFVDVCFEVCLLWLLKKIITNIREETKNRSEIPSGCYTQDEKTSEIV